MYNNLELSKSNTATPYHGNKANHRQLHDYLKYEKKIAESTQSKILNWHAFKYKSIFFFIL